MQERKKTGGRPTSENASLIGDSILAVASALFLKQGYGAVSIEMIARQAGISKRTFYHRFNDKAHLFSAVVDQLVRAMQPVDMAALFEGHDLRAILLHIAHAILKAALSPQALALHQLLSAEASRFPELAQIMNASGTRASAIGRIARLLEAHTKEGATNVNPLFAAEQFLELVMGIPQRRALRLGGNPMTQEELTGWARNSVTLFLHGYAK